MKKSQKLKELRKKMRMTQVEFANLVEIAQPDISAMENGSLPFERKRENKITHKLNLPDNYFEETEDISTSETTENLIEENKHNYQPQTNKTMAPEPNYQLLYYQTKAALEELRRQQLERELEELKKS